MQGLFSPGRFAARHIGPSPSEIHQMLEALGLNTLEDLAPHAAPESILHNSPLNLPAALTEEEALDALHTLAEQNQPATSHIGMGYYDCFTPAVIRRNILENPGWYTAYTPYQAEISQGRLEALLNFQTMVTDLTGMDVANASLLDEATAAAEAMALCHATRPGKNILAVDSRIYPQTLAVLATRAAPLGIELRQINVFSEPLPEGTFAVLAQSPDALGTLHDLRPLAELTHAAGALLIAACDLLCLTLAESPGAQGADVTIGSAQRFGVPMGFGGPHAAFLAVREPLMRKLPGRLVGVSRDARGRPALRLALQTREQHIRREKATSNICTAQVLPAVMAAMYAVYHGPQGLRAIASRVHHLALRLAASLRQFGFAIRPAPFFDTVAISLPPQQASALLEHARQRRINLGRPAPDTLTIALDETTRDLSPLLEIFAAFAPSRPNPHTAPAEPQPEDTWPEPLQRKTPFLTHPVFNSHHTETRMLRYLRRLESRDLSLTTSMIPLGSCTMKLNATAEMLPLSWEHWSRLHPYAPASQAAGYRELAAQLKTWLAEITGLPAVTLQPNAGSQGEYTGLLLIRAWHRSRGEPHRNICLIPVSAHGTNPASAVMAGLHVVGVACDPSGNIDLADLRQKIAAHQRQLAALMITYPSTHGVFEESFVEICHLIHEAGGQVYLDGANFNALVGICRPGDLGVDCCHLNLHKTFCIPHGGGGPGMGPVCAAAHLAEFLPSHPFDLFPPPHQSAGTVSAAPLGSASILVIPWMYIAMMGPDGLRAATLTAILNANYIARRLEPYFPILYKGKNGFVAHECILDLRPWKQRIGIEAEDVAKRLMDYGFHAPTMSWPVAGTLMIEPTESESKEELDRFCDAMIAIHGELRAIEEGRWSRTDNPLKNAPHTAATLAADPWPHPYSRQTAAYPAPWLHEHKYWPPVSRVDNVHGDRNLFCSCPPVAL